MTNDGSVLTQIALPLCDCSGGGLKEWDATNQTFPDGLKSFAEKTDWKFQMHNRYWIILLLSLQQ